MRVFSFVCCLALLWASSAIAAPRLSEVTVEDLGAETRVRLFVVDAVARPGVHLLSDHRLIVDLPGIEPSLASHQVEAGTTRLVRVRVGLHNDPEPRTRVVFDLTGPTAYAVSFWDGGLDVSLRPHGATPEPKRDSPAPAPSPLIAPEPEVVVQAPPTSPSPGATSAPRPTVSLTPRPTASLAPTPTPTPRATATPAPTASPAPTPTQTPTSKPTPSPTPSPRPSPSPLPSPSAEPVATDQPMADAEAVSIDKSGSNQAEPIPAGTVTLDFRDADVRTVIDLVANVGGYDVIFTPEVQGRVTIRIVDAPWEEVLDAILKRKHLRATRHADLILVSPDDWG